ncbi:MFS transporter [Microbacterium sp. RG1]|uniref:MFS transporter n=1 Tax=Microbacterium sp. RG1 TaxID=2489212 RepID=UPI0010CA44BE|nr:MFS transporter [Microbacterium sp. RG1]QCQ18025.1 MFS transporter [Microbacterium sp. RG1]
MPDAVAPVRALRTVPFLAAVNLSALGALTAPAVVGLPVRVAALVPAADRAGTLAVVIAAGALAAIVANPLVGFLSDRTRVGWGRRRPWMLAGAVTGPLATWWLLGAGDLFTLVLAWIGMQVCYNAVLATAAAQLADTVEERWRAGASGIFAAAAFLGTVPPLVIAATLPSQLVLASAIMPAAAVIAVVLCVLFVPDAAVATVGPPSRPSGRPRFTLAPGFAVVWVQRLLLQSAFSLTTAFTLYFVMDRMLRDQASATSITSLSTVLGGGAIVVAAVTMGLLAGRRGDYRPFLAASIVGLIAASLLRAFAAEPIQLWTSALVGGLAMGTFFAVDFALALRTIPAERTGAYLGILNATETIPQVVGPLAAAALLATGGDALGGRGGNYVALYVTAAAVALLALVLLRLVASYARRPVSAPTPADPAPRAHEGRRHAS